jgi:hypothetical protein
MTDRDALLKALVDLSKATAFSSKAARDNFEKNIAALHAAIDAHLSQPAEPMETRKPGDGWEDNAQYLLNRCPHTIRSREGGGAESLLDSLILTFTKMERMLAASQPEAVQAGAEPVGDWRDVIQGAIDELPYAHYLIPRLVALLSSGPKAVAPQIRPFTPAQRRRLWENSPEHHADARSFAGFERIVALTERAHEIQIAAGERSTPAEPSADELSKLAFEGFDSYWTEDCAGSDAEAWAASARAVIKHRDAQWLATPPSAQPKGGEPA